MSYMLSARVRTLSGEDNSEERGGGVDRCLNGLLSVSSSCLYFDQRMMLL